MKKEIIFNLLCLGLVIFCLICVIDIKTAEQEMTAYKAGYQICREQGKDFDRIEDHAIICKDQ